MLLETQRASPMNHQSFVERNSQRFLMRLSHFTLVRHSLEWGMKGLQPYGSGPGSSLTSLLQFRIQFFTICPVLKILTQWIC